MWGESIIAGVLVGAATGAIEQTIAHYASGGKPEGLFGGALWKSIGIGAALGGGLSGLFGGAKAAHSAYKAWSTAAKAVKMGINITSKSIRVVANYALSTFKMMLQSYLVGQRFVYAAEISLLTGEKRRLFPDILSSLLNYLNSPPHATGIPVWAFTGGGWGQTSAEAVLLQTMPLAP